ncbi:hypothetical protein ACO1D2_28145 [Bacillus thuringiensis]|uniref:hypothetical protein n=1 Tax=Bacillus thuringiensis TaxID=1428 RepID=UPI0032F1A7A9|nr:hypothetical protein [Bacillus cereus]
MNKVMETFLEFLKEIIKGVLRENAAHLFKKKYLENKKSTLSYRRRKQKKKGDLVRQNVKR